MPECLNDDDCLQEFLSFRFYKTESAEPKILCFFVSLHQKKTSKNRMKRAIFPGSFNPFTRGHQSIVQRGLQLFDEIVIGIGHNTAKQSDADVQARLQSIAALYRDEPRVSVQIYDTLTVDFAKKVDAKFILRGVRTVQDFDYELQMADVNRLLSGIETVVLFAEADKVAISSSLVRELQQFGKDVSEYLPKN